MNKVLLGTRLLSIAALAGSFCPSLMAQGQSEEHRPFEINGHAWGSKAEFIERGRCVTRQPNEEEAEEMETIFKNAGGGRGNAGGVTRDLEVAAPLGRRHYRCVLPRHPAGNRHCERRCFRPDDQRADQCFEFGLCGWWTSGPFPLTAQPMRPGTRRVREPRRKRR